MKTSSFAGNIVRIVVSLLVVVACSSKKEVDYTDRNIIVGIGSIIQLSSDSTQVNLEDYVLNLASIDSLATPPTLSHKRNGSSLILIGSLPEKIGSLVIWSKKQAYSIPLHQTTKTFIAFRYSGAATDVRIKGEFNGWNASQTILPKTGDAFTTSLLLSPGRFQYLFVVDGKEIRDPANKDSVDNGMGGWNSVLTIAKPDATKLPLLTTHSFSSNSIKLKLENPADKVTVFWENFELPEIKRQDNILEIGIPKEAIFKKRSFVRAWAANTEGISNDVLIPLENGVVLDDPKKISRSDKEAQVLYFMMVDRFNNGKVENDEPVNDQSIHAKANYFGGDIVGITNKIKDGYFSKLGINTLWLSPITQNPKSAYGKYTTPPTTFSAYHGYWPISLQQLDYRFGTTKEFEELLAIAHENNINVILDYVAHHIHQEHPLYKQKPEWFTSLYLPDGSVNTERWDDQRLTTWFDIFLPTLDLRKPEVVGPMTDTAMFWLEQYDLDGFRHDASKHIDLLFWRELTKKVKSRVILPKNKSIYQIGETYGSRELVASYVNSGMLDGQFDFNVYDDAVATFARKEVSFTRLVNSVQESLDYFGDHHLMGNVTGNQDRARFISYADGSIRFDEDTKLAGWTRKIEVRDTLAYNKLTSLTAFMMTLPGVPVIYYGDEIGDPGGNDPDNRRMMRFDHLSSQETTTRAVTTHLAQLRRNNLALIYGDWKIISQTDQQLVIKRSYFNNEVIIAFNKASEATIISLGALTAAAQTNFGGSLRIEKGQASLVLQPHSFEIITVSN